MSDDRLAASRDREVGRAALLVRLSVESGLRRVHRARRGARAARAAPTRRAGDPALGYLVMANPRAISWALEMFGYALFGVATWLVAAQFGATVAWLLRANGVVSVLGAILTAIDLAWVHTTAGLVSFAGWNVLLIGTTTAIAVTTVRRTPPA